MAKEAFSSGHHTNFLNQGLIKCFPNNLGRDTIGGSISITLFNVSSKVIAIVVALCTCKLWCKLLNMNKQICIGQSYNGCNDICLWNNGVGKIIKWKNTLPQDWTWGSLW